ncbi:hypothetical protein CAY59_27005 (plasmid) [Vibrio campbellii]|uniref:hypothetical protein n=1 Tax=Vibrio campbellii TaxID=680 RepID=UPI000A300C59|nr:hypothetical protein [Vibrio campbellii]ARR47879.1 hypothetical protein CAY59_27005 [Vibrio campbellii]
MYVSVDSLPELTPEYQQAQQQAVRDAKVVYQFEAIKERALDFAFYASVTIWLLFGLGSLWLMWVAITDGPWTLALFILFFSGGLLTYFYYAGNPDVKQTVTLTEKGMIVSDLQLVPDACFAALRYSGYVGIAISVAGVVLVGPMMFIGAGAGLLMSFKMAGVENRPKTRVLPFESKLNYEFYVAPAVKYKNNLVQWHMSPMIEMDHGNDDEGRNLYRSNRNFYFSSYAASNEEQNQFLKHLRQFITVTEEG